MKSLKDKLYEYSESGIYPFHMPGHKRNTEEMRPWELWGMDVTEVEGTDNLHHAEGILKTAMERAANISGAEKSWFLVNGSTGGILSAIAAVTKPGDTVLAARNCHKSVYHAIFLNHLKAIYVQPEWIEAYHMAGGIEPQKIGRLLEENPQIRAVILTSPTYEGMVSDIEKIAQLAHAKKIPLIVDEAHGAHFSQEGFPVSAVRMGADIVIQSTHKTLPALTQTGLLHVNGSFVDRERLQEFLAVYQTSSPSYVLMASIDNALSYLEEKRELMAAYGERLEKLRKEIAALSYIRIPGRELVGTAAVYDVDNSKLILSVCGKDLNGKQLYELLRTKYKLQCEMAMEGYALAMTSVLDREEGYERFLRALKEIDAQQAQKNRCQRHDGGKGFSMPAAGEAVLTIAEAFYAEKKACRIRDAAGEVSGEYLYLYPPGAPFLVPGERIDEKLPEYIEKLRQAGFEVQGLSDEEKENILIIKGSKNNG